MMVTHDNYWREVDRIMDDPTLTPRQAEDALTILRIQRDEYFALHPVAAPDCVGE